MYRGVKGALQRCVRVVTQVLHGGRDVLPICYTGVKGVLMHITEVSQKYYRCVTGHSFMVTVNSMLWSSSRILKGLQRD